MDDSRTGQTYSAHRAESQRRQQQKNKDYQDQQDERQYGKFGKVLMQASEAAAAGTASAALMYRAGLGPAFQRGLNFSTKFAKNLSNRTTSKMVEDWTIDDFRKFGKDFRSSWADARKEAHDHPIDIGRKDSRSMFSAMSDFMTGERSKFSAGVNKTWRSQEIILPMSQKIDRMASLYHMDANRAGRYKNFVEKIAANPNDERHLYSTAKKMGLQDDDFAKKLIDHVQKIDNDTQKKNAFKKRQRRIFHNAYKKSMDIDEQERHYGTSDHRTMWDRASGTRAATVDDILANKDKAFFKKYKTAGKPGSDESDPIEDLMRRQKIYARMDSLYGTNLEDRFLHITPDASGVRIDSKGNFYSGAGGSEIIDKFTSFAAGTLPGKVAKMRDVSYARMAPQFIHIAKGSNDSVLASLTNSDENKKLNIVDSEMFYINDKMYRVGEDGGLSEIEGMPDLTVISNKYGAAQHILHQMSGNVRYKEGSNWFSRTFDVFQDRDEYSGNSPFNKFAHMTGNGQQKDFINTIVKDFTDPDRDETKAYDLFEQARDNDLSRDYVLDYIDRAGKLHDYMEERTYEFSSDVAAALAKNADGEAKNILDALSKDSADQLEDMLMDMDPESIKSSSLRDMVTRLKTNPDAVHGSIRQKVSRDRTHIGYGIADLFATSFDNETADFDKQLRTELSKEAMLRSAYDENASDFDYGKMFDLIDKSDLGRRDSSEASRLAHLARMERQIDFGYRGVDGTGKLSTDELWDEANRIRNTITHGDKYTEDLQSKIQDINAEHAGPWDVYYDEPDEIANPQNDNEWAFLHKTTGVTDVLRSMNDWTKFKATSKHFVGQFAAGRDNMGDVSHATMAPYFMLSRLSDEMNSVGLGFSKDSMGSTGSMMAAIMLKRVLPVAIGATYLEWMDDTSQEITGQSMSGAMARGVADVDIASRKVLDAIGLTDWLKGEKAINPIMQYWGGHGEFQNADERKKWYDSGYTPVRNGAWWTFGGVNEARGSEIQYFEPTFARRIESDYKDKSLYDGYFDKWSHSLLPTPSNPLSPLKALLDPYWLEEKHKDDRPYELTGHMFTDGTPWGAVLNPTIGQLIKPQKSLHTFLGFNYRNINGVDPKSLMRAINEEIQQKARDIGHRNYIKLHNDQMTPVDIDEYNAPTPDTSVLSFDFSNGKYSNAREGAYGVYNPQDNTGTTPVQMLGSDPNGGHDLSKLQTRHVGWREALDFKFFGGRDPSTSLTAVNGKGKVGVAASSMSADEAKDARSLKLEDEIAISKLGDGDHLGIKDDLQHLVEKINPKNWIRELNGTTMQKAARVKTVSKDEFDQEEGIVHGDKLKGYRPSSAMELLNDPDTVTQLINAGKGSDFVKEASVSWRLISGIYGYGLGEATGFGVDNQKRIATGQDMTSFPRTFWDENLGGLGGSAMEIARRFIPNYRRSARLNPLANTMPDWLPDRFRYGDPFTQTQKGEMRLPGKGYESLNDLHPDQYGQYGAFDRMKILADIAPFSPEYRLWRDIAKKTITDPELIDEMGDIRDRVNQQGKKHDFYDYKVIGHGLEYKKVVVSEILGYGKFRSGNSIFKIAGAHLKANADETMTDVLGRYLHVGEDVTVAVDQDAAARTNKDSVASIDAAVFAGNQNIGQEMIKNGDASVRKGDTSSAAVLANYGPMQRGLAYISEAVAHMDIPWVSDQFLRVRSPLESYEAEQVYGTPYQTWSHPIDSFLMPAIERAAHHNVIASGAIGAAYRYFKDKPGLSAMQNHVLTAAHLFTDRGAFIGAALASLIKPEDGGAAMRWARHGSTIRSVLHFGTGGNSYMDEMASGAGIGAEVARIFKKNKVVGGAIGTAVGALYRSAVGLDGEWIPDRVRKRWAMEDYFDRLTYIKFTGLYQAAAKKAKEEEDVNIDDVIKRREKMEEKNKEALEQFKDMKKQLQRNAMASDERTRLMGILNEKIDALQGSTMVLPGGEWTRTALLYKQAADATMYGLKKGSSWSQLITALPQNDREYFMEFVKEGNSEKRNSILRIASPQLRKALQLAWGKKPPKTIDNKEYFKKHELPVANWAGWAPQADLKDVKMKTIANEGMMLSDFGYYESQLNTPEVQSAPTLKYHNRPDASAVKQNLKKELEGKGLKGVDISVTPGPSGGATSITASIKTMLGMDKAQKQVNDSLVQQSS